MAYSLPQDGYDTFLTAALGTADTEAFVNVLPTQSSGVLTIYAQDGRTISEKISYSGTSGSGTSTSPYKLTGLVRDIRLVPVAGAILFTTGGTPKSHGATRRVAMTDNVNYLGVALAVLNGDMPMGGVMQLPSSRSIDSARDVTDKEYVDAAAASAGGITAFMVSQNGADPSLTINIGAGRLVSGTEVVAYAGASASAVTNNATNYVQIDWNGTTLINTTGFLEGYVPLAEVVTSGGDITSITDRRAWLTSNGASDKVITDRFTYGATIAVGNAVYLDTADAKWKLLDATSSATASGRVGIALDAGVNNDTGKRVQIEGVVTDLSGLTAGYQYATNTPGAYSTSQGTFRKVIGRAINSTTMILMDTFNVARLTGSNSATTTDNLNELMNLINTTDVTGPELETLTSGPTSNADSLHTHAVAPAFQQINTGLAATLNCGQAAYDAATGDFYLAIKTTAGTTFDIYRFSLGTHSKTWQKDTVTVSSSSFDGVANGGLMVGATYVWLVGRASGGGDIRIVRFNKDLTGAQVMTISGTANTDVQVSVTGDDSTLYVKSATSSTRLAVYTISGTTATRGSDISLTSGGDDMCISDGLKFYSFAKGSPSSFRRYALSGGAAEATITRHLAEADNLSINDGSGMSLIGFNSYNTNTFIVFLIHLEELGTTDRYIIDALLVDKT